jgi:hypothetical protein
MQSGCWRSFAALAVGLGNVILVLGFLARAEAAGRALGDKAPVRLTSRGDRTRLVASADASVRIWAPEARACGDEPGVAKAVE